MIETIEYVFCLQFHPITLELVAKFHNIVAKFHTWSLFIKHTALEIL